MGLVALIQDGKHILNLELTDKNYFMKKEEEKLPKWIRGKYSNWNEWGVDCYRKGKEAQKDERQKLIDSNRELSEALSQLLYRLEINGNIDAIREEGPIEDAKEAINNAKNLQP